MNIRKLSIVLTFIPLLTFAQYDTEAEVIDFLAGSAYKDWSFERLEPNMGTGPCENGKKLRTYYTDKKVTIKSCVNAEWKEDKYTYSLYKKNKYDWRITFKDDDNDDSDPEDGKTYKLVMTNRPSDQPVEQEQKLRTIRDGKVVVELDIVLLHYIDD